MLFKDVIAQDEVKQQLAGMVHQNRLSHALLFLGKEGTGGLPLALAFAQFMVCEKVNGTPTAAAPPAMAGLFGEPEMEIPVQTNNDKVFEACGECAPCKKAEKFIHPDIHFAFPVIPRKSGDKPKSNDYIKEWREFIAAQPYGNVYDWLQFIGAENKQGNITADECNEITRQLSLKSFESEYKILLMWMPEYLGNAGNKLLKLIEEPPPNTVFILVAENEEKIISTILSRTQLVKIPLLQVGDIEKALIERNQTLPDQARQLAAIAEGNYHEALQLVQHAEEDWLSVLKDWMNAIVKGGPIVQVKWIDETAKLGREKQKQFLRYFNHMLEQCIRLRIMGDDYCNLSEGEKEFAARLNKVTGVSQQQAIIAELDKAVYFVERNAHGKMLFHALTLKLKYIIKDKVVMSVE